MNRVEAWRWAAGSCVLYVLYAILGRDTLPFAAYPMFAFPSSDEPTAVPYFAVDGRTDDVTRYDAFFDLSPDRVDVAHEGTRSGVQHMFLETRAWIASHPGEGAGGDARPCAVGLVIVSVSPEGRVERRVRIDDEGRCRPR